MHVRLFHTLRTDGRTSMDVYGRELGRALRELESGQTFSDHVPAPVLASRAPVRTRRLAAHLDHYLLYQFAARRRRAQVNHVTDHGYAHLAWSLGPRRTVVTFHDAMLLRLYAGELPTDFRPRRAIAAQRFNSHALRSAAAVVADSESSRADLLRFVGCDPARVSVVPLGVTERFFDPAPGLAAPDGRLRLLHVGHTGFYKNIEAIIRALPVLSRRLGAAVTFVKVGSAFTPAQEALIDTVGVRGAVLHLGQVPDEALPAVYGGTDVLIMPSLLEGFGLPVLEAMAAGCPVVASRAGSLPEVVGDAGVLLDGTDPEAIADAVASIVADPRRKEDLVQRGRARARAHSWTETATRMLHVYRAVAEG